MEQNINETKEREPTMAISHDAWQARMTEAREYLSEDLAQYNNRGRQRGLQPELFDTLTEPVIIRLGALGTRSSFSCEGHWDARTQLLSAFAIGIDVDSNHMDVWRRFLPGFLCGDGGTAPGRAPVVSRLANITIPRFLVGFVWEMPDDTETLANQRRHDAISQLCAWLDDVGPTWI